MKKTTLSVIENCETLIPKWAFINLVTVYEAWMSDVLRAILREYPKKITKEKVESSFITDSASYEECLEKLIDAELVDIFYAGPKEATKRLQEITSIDIETFTELADIFELKAARDVLLHNKGIVNKVYLRKTGDKARAKEGEEITIDSEALLKSFGVMYSFIKNVSNKLEEKFKKAEDSSI